MRPQQLFRIPLTPARLVGAWLALLLALLFLAAPAQARDVLRYGMQLEPPILDPTSGAASAIDEVATGTIFEGLVRTGPGGVIEPALAESWEIAPDGRLYVFHLRHGVRFQDGAPFDASVVRFSLDRARAAGSLNAQKAYLSVIERVETPDPWTVRLVLSRPTTPDEADRGLSYVSSLTAKMGSAGSRLLSWQSLCHALLAANEFIYLE